MNYESSADDPDRSEEAHEATAELPVGLTENRMLPCRLEEHELVEAVRAACEARHVVDAREKELKETTTELREILKAAESDYNHKMDLLEQGKGDKSVPCEERLDYENGVVLVHRLDVEPDDPDRIVERRAMTDEERQANLPLGVDGQGQVYDKSDNSVTMPDGHEEIGGDDQPPRPIVCPHCGQDHPAEECPQGAAPQQVENIEGHRRRRKV